MSLVDAGAVEAIDAIVEEETEADVIVRRAVDVLAGLPGARWAGIAFVEDALLVLGPAAGAVPDQPAAPAVHVPVRYGDSLVAELWIDTDARADADDQAVLARVADRLSPYCLVGWDTGGAEWVNE
jgi:putative methionine-R-sulfoxide reductase with GAF domain